MTTQPEPESDAYRDATSESERWLLARMQQQASCKHPKSHDDGGIEYCNVCGKSLRVNTYRD